MLLAVIHGVFRLIWFVLLVPFTQRVAKVMIYGSVLLWLDRVTGSLFMAFGLRLALEGRR